MASSRTKAWGPTHPSTAFLIKCAKEKEKLRSSLQNQLQEHMLHMLENNIFSDTLIAINSTQKESSTLNETSGELLHPNLPQLVHTHKAILKVRCPTFYKHLSEHEETNLNVVSLNSYLQEEELSLFLRKIYTDDDIRKQECESLSSSKKYIQLLQHKKCLLNKHISEVDDFEKESINSACTDSFVTPKTSPLSPEPKLDILNMYSQARKQNGNLSKNSENYLQDNTAKLHGKISNGLYINSDSEEDNPASPEAREYITRSAKEYYTTVCFGSQNGDKSLSSSEEEDSNEVGDISNIGSMVRSNTFDLETQSSLEQAAIEDSIEWCSKPTDIKDDENETKKVTNQLLPCKLEGASFFLHDHSPPPKSNVLRTSFSKEPLVNNGQDSESKSPSSNFRRLESNMSDSGFLSHSTYSLLSDAGFSNSVASSLIMSSDGITSSPITNITIDEVSNQSVSDKAKRLSGSMFPFYIDINNLPSSKVCKEDKSSPKHTYMYIDAKNQKVNVSSMGHPYLNTSYDEFFSGIEANDDFISDKFLVKAQSTSHLDQYKRENKFDGLSQLKEKPHKNSCYMYVDLDSVQPDQEKSSDSKPQNKECAGVSMFIELNDDSANKTKQPTIFSRDNFSLQTQESNSFVVNKISKNGIRDKRKLSDPFSMTTPLICENKNKFLSLNRQRESHSAASLDHQLLKRQDVFAQLKPNSSKLKNTNRYSDGIYYDNINQNKLAGQEYYPFNRMMSVDHNNYENKDMKACGQAVKLLQCFGKNEESSGSCSNLGKLNLQNKLLSDDKVKWKSTGDMEKPKCATATDNPGLLPMSPILRRKPQAKVAEEQPSSITIKASTKPQDIDAMKFPKSLIDEKSKLSEKIVKNGLNQCLPTYKNLELAEDSKSSSESLKLTSEGLSESSDLKSKATDSISRSGSSKTTSSGVDSSSDKLVSLDFVKSRQSHSFSSVRHEFEDDSETIYSEVSDISSSFSGMNGVASLERHWKESQNELAGSSDQIQRSQHQFLETCSKLGQDLLQMFLAEVDTDIVVEVEDKQIKAHRCILSARCKYFANLLQGNYSETKFSTLSLEGFSHSSVHFALCHIYSGAMNIPKDCNISELALLASMLSLDSLTDVIIFHLKMNYCHFFHRPCLQCSQGVVECLPLATTCGLNKLRDKCIYWLGKNFTQTWTTKAFAALSEEMRDLCYDIAAKNLTLDTVIDTTLNCDRLLTTLPQLKWTEPIFGMITKLLQDCIHFMARNFNQILNSEGFLTLGKGQSWNVTALEEDVISSIELTTPDVACKSYDSINRLLLLVEAIENTDCGEFTQNFVDLLHKISRHLERYLIQNANKVAHCQSWACLSPHVQKRIKDAAVIVFEFEKPTAPPPRLSSLQKKLKKQNDGEDMGCLERATYPRKGKGLQNQKHPRDFSPKNGNTFCKSPSPERNMQQRETNNVKKIVSPIKEEVQNSSMHNSSYDLLSGPQNPFAKSLNKAYMDFHEEDSLRDLQDLPQDLTNQAEPGSESQLLCSVASLDMDDTHSPLHCSDNPDSLETNEISSDSKDDLDVSVSVEDGSNQEKGVNEKPEVLDKNLEPPNVENEVHSRPDNSISAALPKTFLPIPVKDKPSSEDASTNKETINVVRCDKSPIKKIGKSLLPLAKTHIVDETKPLVNSEPKEKDLVAEIDADSRMVNHCLQEAEMLEQQLSRKLQRQHGDITKNSPYTQTNSPKPRTPVDYQRSSKSYGSRLQKASSTSQIRNFASSPSRGRSPGRVSKSNVSTPVSHSQKSIRCNESVKEKALTKKSPKSSVSISRRSMESIVSVQKQVNNGVQTTLKKSSSRSKVITVRSVHDPK